MGQLQVIFIMIRPSEPSLEEAKKISEAIKSQFSNPVALAEGYSYALLSDQNASMVLSAISSALSPDDSVYVVPAPGTAAASRNASPEADQWIRRNLA